MIPIRTSLVTIVLSISGAVAFTQPSVVHTGQVRAVHGRVIDAGTGRPIEGVKIAVFATQLGIATNVEGKFALKDVPSGSARVDFRHPCYLPVQVTTPIAGDVDIEMGLPFDNASLQRPGCGGLGARKKG